MSVATCGFDTLALQSNGKVRNQVDLASETPPNRYGLRAAGTLCRASESLSPEGVLFLRFFIDFDYCLSRRKSPRPRKFVSPHFVRA